MKKSSKKRVLLSSVAMLMVGAVSLGTATFAWFTNNKVVTADGMNVTSSAAKGLQITATNGAAAAGLSGEALTKNEKQWGPTAKFPTTTTAIQPLSVDYTVDNSNAQTYDKIKKGWLPGDVKNTGAWETGKEGDFTGWTEVEDTDYPTVASTVGTEAVGSSNYYVAYEVGVRATGDDIQGVKLDVNVQDATKDNMASKYMRVAILEQSSGTPTIEESAIKAVIGNESGANAVTSVTTSDTEKNADGSWKEIPTTVDQKLEGTVGDDGVLSLKGITIGEVTKSPKYYTVLVWFEGQDGECVDDYTNATGNIDVKFYYE